MNKLSEQEIDKELMDRDERKPLRKVIDDHIAPAAAMVVGGGLAAASALGNIQTTQRLHTVK